MAVITRTATLDDAPALLGYAERLLGEKLPGIWERDVPTLDEEVEFVRSYVEPPKATLLLAEKDGEVVGTLGFAVYPHRQEQHCGMFGVSVGREHRGEGIGTRLIEELLAWAPTVGITRIELGVWSNNPGAAALYRRLGFEDEGCLRGAVIVDGEPVDVYMLAKLLPA